MQDRDNSNNNSPGNSSSPPEKAVPSMAQIVPEPRSSRDDCYITATARGQRTFTLVEQDLTTPAVICEWIKLNIETAPAEKLIDALAIAIKMRNYPRREHAD